MSGGRITVETASFDPDDGLFDSPGEIFATDDPDEADERAATAVRSDPLAVVRVLEDGEIVDELRGLEVPGRRREV